MENAKVVLPNNVEDYLRKNATRLLHAPTDLTVDTFKTLMGYEEDYQLPEFEVKALSALLEHYHREATNGQNGIFAVLNGGKALPKTEVELFAEGAFSGEINGIIANIRLFHEVPDNEATLSYDNDGLEFVVRILADFFLDGELIMVGYVPSEDCISFFTVEFDEQDHSLISSVTDDERFELIAKIWKALEEVELGGIKH